MPKKTQNNHTTPTWTRLLPSWELLNLPLDPFIGLDPALPNVSQTLQTTNTRPSNNNTYYTHEV